MGREVDIELLEEYNKAIPRYTSYPTAVDWSECYGEVDYKEALLVLGDEVRGGGSADGVSLYIHIPFCAERCYYCACHVIIDKNRHYVEKYIDYLEKEIKLFEEEVGQKLRVKQLHWGGGTPTFLNEDELKRLYNVIEKSFEIEGGSEQAIEIDPCVTTKEQLTTLYKLGFNRLSMGVQDFDERVQDAVNRHQSYEFTRELIEHGRRLGFKGTNVDLIYGLPLQSVKSFELTVDKVMELEVDRVALFSYAKVPWIKPHQKRIEDRDLPSLREKFAIFLMARKKFMGVGYKAIGMDHFAREGDELSDALTNKRLHRNFMGYTVSKTSNYIGFGVSSIGYVSEGFVQNVKTLREYYACLDRDELPICRGLKLDRDDLIRKWVIESIMCEFSLNFASFKKENKIDFREYFKEELKSLKEYEAVGLVKVLEGGIEISKTGCLFVRNIASVFDKYLREKGESRFSKAI